MGMNIKDMELLLALVEDPTISITELAEKLKLSRPTVKARLDNLKERGMIRKPIVLYKPETLGLERKHVLVEVSSKESIKLLEDSCDTHPYTVYRARTFGGKFGLYMQFEVPPNTLGLLKEYFQILKQKKYINTFRIYESSGLRQISYPDLEKFNSETLSWNFSWDKWFRKLKSYPTSHDKTTENTSIYTNYKPIQFKILRELTSNASNATKKQSELKEKFNLSKTDAHRHYNYVMDNYVDKVRLLIDKRSFNLTETYIAVASSVTQERKNQLYNLMKDNPPPFHVSLDILKGTNLFMWGNMSASQASEFAFSIWNTLQNVEVYILNTKDKGSRNYWFYDENYDFDNKCWKTSSEYMVKEPLSNLGIEI